MQVKVLVQRSHVSRVCESCERGTEERRRASVGADTVSRQPDRAVLAAQTSGTAEDVSALCAMALH